MRLQKSLVGAVSLTALFPLAIASAQGLAAHGPLSADNGYPEWYEDNNGLRLDQCLNDSGLCLTENLIQITNPGAPYPDNYGGSFPEEFFWAACEAQMPTNNGGAALLVIAIEGSHIDEIIAAGNQTSFARLRIRVDNLVAGANYSVTTPVGVFNFVAANAGVRGINFTDDVGRDVPNDFTGALNGATGPFLTWDSGLPIFDAQGREYIGNPAVEHTITGSPFGTNLFRIEGPSVGGPNVNSIETNLFAVMGMKSVVVPPAEPVAAFNSAPNSGTAPLNVAFTDASTGNITSWSWDFGDASGSALQNPSHVYAAGTFSVSLTVSGPDGSDTLTKPNLIVVTNAPPGLVLANPTPGTAGVANSYVVTGATPGRVVGVYSGLVLGASSVNLGGCGGIPIGIATPRRLLGRATANGAGIATIVAGAPAGAAGKTFHAQAVEPFSCRASNVASEIF